MNGSGAFLNSVGPAFETFMNHQHSDAIKLQTETVIDHLLELARTDMNSYLNDYAVAGYFAESDETNATRGLFNYEILHSPGMALNAIDNVLLK